MFTALEIRTREGIKSEMAVSNTKKKRKLMIASLIKRKVVVTFSGSKDTGELGLLGNKGIRWKASDAYTALRSMDKRIFGLCIASFRRK